MWMPRLTKLAATPGIEQQYKSIFDRMVCNISLTEAGRTGSAGEPRFVLTLILNLTLRDGSVPWAGMSL